MKHRALRSPRQARSAGKDPKPDARGSQLQLDNQISSLLETENPGPSRLVRTPCHPVTLSPRPPIPRPPSKRRTDSPAPAHGNGMHCPRRRAIGRGMAAAGHTGGVAVYALRFTICPNGKPPLIAARGRGRSWADQAGADPQALTSDRATRLRSGPSLGGWRSRTRTFSKI
jgi:hypothetical protein